jgi:hypothetical protein
VDNGKLESRAIKCVFLGYGSGVKGYKLWNPETKKSMLTRSVVFNESEMYSSNNTINAHDDVPQKVNVQVEHSDEGDHVIHDDVCPRIHGFLMLIQLLLCILLFCSLHNLW